MSKHVVTSRGYTEASKRNEIFVAILYILFGLITAICGEDMLDIVVEVVGILFIILAILTYAATRYFGSVVFTLILGILFLFLGVYGLGDDAIRIVFGVMVILTGLMMLLGTQASFIGYLLPDKKSVLVNTVIGIIMIIIGIIVTIDWGGSFDIIVRAVGVIILVLGAADLAKAIVGRTA